MVKHQKHTKLIRRNYGNYAFNEISFLGAKCSTITDLIRKIAGKQQKTAKIAYLDASHNSEMTAPILDTFTFHHSGNLALNSEMILNSNNSRIQFSQYDLVCINGNHYRGEKQVLILDNEKEASVLKRLDELDNIQFVIKMDEDVEYFDFLTEKHPAIKNLNCYLIDEMDKISKHIGRLIQEETPSIQGLILAGGKSTRMGIDKGLLNYHGVPQRDYLYKQLNAIFVPFQEEKGVYISVREHQEIANKNTISDCFIGLGPFGAICSAFQENPNSAWLVIATDVPFVDKNLIRLLLEKRNPKKIATALKGKDNKFPEPLIAIWEPKAYPILLNYLAQGYSCPRKVLINSDVEIVEVDEHFIQNINTPSEYEKAKRELKK
ncbi:MAG: molybdenum cofactor guanylyltransferase [Flavobacteriaceae bacterium]|nr:molybdenum cofactor guanylyltransferase [Flavobacteriaceae bacterium]